MNPASFVVGARMLADDARLWLARHQHWAHEHLHAVYFGLVAVEGHGYYSLMAAALFGLSAISFLLSEGEL